MRKTHLGLAALAVAGMLLGGVRWPTSDAPPQAVAGEHLSIQQWLGDREAPQIELNNTLVKARQLTTSSRQATTTCEQLARVSGQLLHGSRAPHPQLNTAANVGIAQFAQAAQACLAGDLPLMRHRIDDGTTLRAEAQDTLDQLLHGDHGGH
ncbi:hypothetical protein LWC34_05010 [Kibdelosporangium philippinense]|uniref:DUF732 domain-containing protein n=1 Tax=Kibdelosporangium philippinense TaxID=211113 RepID=A0ABS8Z578_9PSEU|nr:hypothetical protein [Kibdelosporangium philippinense]MCE7002188.1 hypothetical protein [Kibdelosporangium philippinense]